MFQFLYVFGPAAVTFLIVNKLSGKSNPNGFVSVIELLAYAAFDTGLTILVLYPLGRMEFVITSFGMKNIQFGATGFFLSLIFSFVVGLIISAVYKRIDIRLEITKKRDPNNNEEA